MKINTDKLSIKISLDTEDIDKIMDEYKENNALLIVKKDSAPLLFIDGESYPVTQLSYQYITNTATMLGTNRIVAQYIDGNIAKEIMIDNQNGHATYGNQYQWGTDYAES